MLTDTAIRTAKPGTKPYKLVDGKGLYVDVRPSGSKTFRYRFKLRVGGLEKESIHTIGDYCTPPPGESDEAAATRRAGGRLTLAEARIERERLRGLVKQGINPGHARRLEKLKAAAAHGDTLERLSDEWLATKDWEEVTKRKRRAMLARVVFPKLGALPVRHVTPQHVLDVLQTAERDNGPTVAAEAKRSLSGIFALAVSTLRADMDPVYPVRGALKPVKTQHKRALSPAEIGQLLRDIDAYHGRYETAACFKLMWWTLCRPSEAVEAEWAELDLDAGTWHIPAHRMKRRKAHAVPLPVQAVEMLRGLHGVTGTSRFVFPNRDSRRQPIAYATLRAGLHGMGWSGRYSPHATRTTGSTRLNEMRYHADVVEAQLAHVETNKVRGTYNHAQYMDERKAMMQGWADYLDSLKRGDTNVVPLRASRAG